LTSVFSIPLVLLFAGVRVRWLAPFSTRRVQYFDVFISFLSFTGLFDRHWTGVGSLCPSFLRFFATPHLAIFKFNKISISEVRLASWLSPRTCYCGSALDIGYESAHRRCSSSSGSGIPGGDVEVMSIGRIRMNPLAFAS
jgi:hypothetical protein